MRKLRAKGLSNNYHSLPHPLMHADLVYLCHINGQHGIFYLRGVTMSNCAPPSQVIELICTFGEMMYLNAPTWQVYVLFAHFTLFFL